MILLDISSSEPVAAPLPGPAAQNSQAQPPNDMGQYGGTFSISDVGQTIRDYQGPPKSLKKTFQYRQKKDNDLHSLSIHNEIVSFETNR